MQKIVIGFDGSQNAEVAARLAMEIAGRFDAELLALNVFDISLKSTEDIVGLKRAISPQIMRAHLAKERAAAEYVVKTWPGHPGRSSRVRQELGHPAEAILRVTQSEQADLMVLGRHGMSRSKRSRLGEVAHILMHHAATPILFVQEPSRPFQRILLAFDGSASAVRATRIAYTLAQKFDSCITALHVVETPGWVRFLAKTSESERLSEVVQERIARSQAIRDALQEAEPGAGALCGVCVKAGHPGEIILSFAADRYDLIVLGSRGLGGFERMLLGSVAREVTENADCTVLLTP